MSKPRSAAPCATTGVLHAPHDMERHIDALHRGMLFRDILAHKTAHDLRTPINTMSGLLHLLSQRFDLDQHSKTSEYVGYMRRALAQMEALTDTFSDHTRTSSASTMPEMTDLRSALDDVLKVLHHEITAASATCNISGSGSAILADPFLLRIMLTNLMRNALHFRHPNRKACVDITLRRMEDGAVGLRIADNGTGFDPAQAHAIFLPFRNDTISGREHGMGLAACRDICRKHGWGITAQSDGKTGATFDITFVRRATSAED